MKKDIGQGIAIIGMGCRYPDARSPGELWENVLAKRQAFRRMPPERLRLEDYLSVDRSVPDSIYSTEVALLEGYEFDRLSFQVSLSTFRSADLAHWLALDTAACALTDAGFPNGEGLPRDTTGVCLGNTLTGEFSRTNIMRLRWPYVRRVMEKAIVQENWSPGKCRAFFDKLEDVYKRPFPPVDEETLAGGLSNTIAGRICNYFDLKGCGYTVDGACSSSLLAVTSACSALLTGDLDVALAGGVDLSLDPFELVGFAKMGALASHEMRVYDAHSEGFWPGEGCGFVVLMRYREAVEKGRRIYGVIRGFGISSDGSGGITRPEVNGQLLMLNRAYRRAGFGIETVTYFEGHGTGTEVGDTTELRALSRARREAGRSADCGSNTLATIGSIKANIGHTKAAAGVAGLIKATMALYTQILPPTTGCETPHPELTADTAIVQIQEKGKSWPAHCPLRAGVSAMGFGGINTHIVLEGIANKRRKRLSRRENVLLSSFQDAELFLIGAQDRDDLRRQVEHLLSLAPRLSRAELTDLAAESARRLRSERQLRMERGPNGSKMRAAVLASTPAELTAALETLRLRLISGARAEMDIRSGIFLGTETNTPGIGFLFPGQGIPAHLNGGALRYRFDRVQDLFTEKDLSITTEVIGTDVAQPAIAAASLAGLRVLTMLGVGARIAVGHSLGELVAYHWASALDESALLRIATVRGMAMARLDRPVGAMAGITAGQHEVERLFEGEPVVIACLNAPGQTVISGETNAVARVVARARTKGLKTVNLPVLHAFHSPLVAAAAPVLASQLSGEVFHPLQRTVVSTVTGATLIPGQDLRSLLYRQVTQPVRFVEAVTVAEKQVDLFIEVGPGAVLCGLIGGFVKTPAVALDVCGSSLKGLLKAVGAAFVLGAPVNHKALFAGRFTRSFSLDWRPRFFVNPCELAPIPETASQCTERGRKDSKVTVHSSVHYPQAGMPAPPSIAELPLDLIRRLVAKRTELPLPTVKDDSRMLSDLHLNSITVSQIVSEAARSLGLPPPVLPMNYANARVAEIAQALEDMAEGGVPTPADSKEQPPSGVGAWIRAFTVELVERPLPRHQATSVSGIWKVIAPDDYPLKVTLQEALTHLGRGGTPSAVGTPSAGDALFVEHVAQAGGGVVVCVPPGSDERRVGLLLAGARAVLTGGVATRFVLVQNGGSGAAFARTLHLEVPGMTTCVVDVPFTHPKATEWVTNEVVEAAGYTEAHYDSSGRRWEPTLRPLPTDHEGGTLPLGPSDVLLVTGGGKGITAECALALARDTGARLALLGRSQPDADAELEANLGRMAGHQIHFRYVIADVTDPDAVRAAVDTVTSDLGPITGILHGAGRNVPQSVNALDETHLLSTLAPKIQGVRNLLAAVNPDVLRLFVTFGSIIARTGLPGEAHYGLANEELTHLTEQFQKDYPSCQCLAVEWSVWSDIGMGRRIGGPSGIDRLIRQGVTPIPTDKGISILRRLLSQRLPSVSVVVTGRFGDPPTLKMEKPELPLLRFLEKPRVYYPGVELIADAALSVDADPYLEDHIFRGQRLFPAVMGLEAMAQISMALMGAENPPVFEEIKFNRPIVVSDHAPVLVRIAALVHGPDQVEVVLRTGETAFQTDHFRAICRFNVRTRNTVCGVWGGEFSVGIDPKRDLYGGILFQGGRFQRLGGYRRLSATECVAEITTGGTTGWFGRYLSGKLVLGDPAARDAAIHAVQACIPHATVLPIGIDRLVPGIGQTPGPWSVAARERSRKGDTFIYDLEVMGADGYIYERLEGVQLRVVEKMSPRTPWIEPLLGPYIERRIRELIPGSAVHVAVSLEVEAKGRLRSDRTICQALGKTVPVHRRPDGKPEVAGEVAGDEEITVSAAHTGDLTLAVAGVGPIGCDVEPVVVRPASIWRDLLGQDRFYLMEFMAKEVGEDQGTSATRVWAASECLKKAGAMANTPLTLSSLTEDGWVQMVAGAQTIATHVAPTRGTEGMLVLAVLVSNGHL